MGVLSFAAKTAWAGASTTAKMGWGAAKMAAPVAAGGAKYGYKAGAAMYPAANTMTRMMTGGTIPQIGAVAGLGMAGWAALRGPGQMVDDMRGIGGVVQGMGDAMAQASAPRYGLTAFQQSVQGLTFGLHSRRNG